MKSKPASHFLRISRSAALIAAFLLFGLLAEAQAQSTCVLSADQFLSALYAGKIRTTVTTNLKTLQATATVVNATGCTAPMSLSSYRMFDGVLSHQKLYDGTATVYVGAAATFTVRIPACKSQVDLWYGNFPRALQDVTYALPRNPGFVNGLVTTAAYCISQCKDGIDNDRDGYADWGSDNGCLTGADDDECDRSLTQCDNCLDDDKDGLTDMADPACKAPWGTTEVAPNGCVLTPAQFLAGIIAGQITSNITTDQNTLQATATIVNRTGCTAPISLSSYSVFDPLPVLSTQRLYDRSSTIQVGASATLTVRIPCCKAQVDLWYGTAPTQLQDIAYGLPRNPAAFNARVTTAAYCGRQCNDGIDNDRDGYTDFGADNGCVTQDDNDECAPSLTQCDNCLDDDRDGLTDMADPDCKAPWGTTEAGTGCVLTPEQFLAAINAGKVTSSITTDAATNRATATLTNTTGCTAPISLSSYSVFDPLPVLSTQRLYDRSSTVQVGASATFTVRIPSCKSQVDLWYGTAPTELQDIGYGLPRNPAAFNARVTTAAYCGGQCRDGIDNDRDGYSDWGSDDGCVTPDDSDECAPGLTQCDNCIDDDRDGRIDMADSNCTVPWGTSESGSGCGASATSCTSAMTEPEVAFRLQAAATELEHQVASPGLRAAKNERKPVSQRPDKLTRTAVTAANKAAAAADCATIKGEGARYRGAIRSLYQLVLTSHRKVRNGGRANRRSSEQATATAKQAKRNGDTVVAQLKQQRACQ